MQKPDTTRRSRREFLQTAAAASLCAGTAASATASEDHPAATRRHTRVLRIAHLTDIHVQPERKAGEGLAACLHHVQNLRDRPDMILNGGDAVMDTMSATEARTRIQWDLWRTVIRNECSLPIESCIGNHDVWGIHKKDSQTTGAEPLYGKKWAMEALGLSKPYRSFDRAGWHFIVLDSTLPQADSYIAKLDDQQFDWLTEELRRTGPQTPVLILSHIPILSVAAFMDGENEKDGDWRVPGSWMHIDARKLKDLFLKHPNVKLCLSGHLHLVDRVDYLGVTYLCNGAVCAAWWKGDYQECEPGYGLVDLFGDGTFEHRYVTYGWKAVEEDQTG